MGPKVTACMGSWGKIMDKIYKEAKKPSCHFWRAWSKNRMLGTKSRVLHTPSSLSTTSESESRSVTSNSLGPQVLSSWNSPAQNTGVGSLSLLQGIFPTQGSNPALPHCRRILYQLSHKGSPRILEWVAYSFSRGSSWPRNRTRVSCITGGFFTNWAMREAPAPPEGWANCLSHYSSLTWTHAHPEWGTSLSPWAEWARKEPVVCSYLPSAVTGAPVKPWLEKISK